MKLATSLLSVVTLLGCASSANESSSNAAAEVTAAAPTIAWTTYATASTTRYGWKLGTADGFLHAGTSFLLSLDAYHLYLNRADTLTLPHGDDDLAAVSADVTVTYYANGAAIGTESHPTHTRTTYVGTEATFTGETDAFHAPANADDLAVALVVHDARDASIAHPVASLLDHVRVIGGHLPTTTALFDAQPTTSGVTEIARVLEAPTSFANADVRTTYSEARAQHRLGTLDSSIGKQDIVVRGGNHETVTVGGKVDFEVWMGVDDGSGFGPEVQLPRVVQSAVLPPFAPDYVEAEGPAGLGGQITGRAAYESVRHVGAATKSKVYFHLKAFVTAQYSPGIEEPRFPADGRYLIAEVYDNPNGSGTNYEFAFDAR